MVGHCSYYCDSNFPLCGKPGDKLEHSIQLFLPSDHGIFKMKGTMHPYRRSYSKLRDADWETNSNYCYERVFQDIVYHAKLFLDMMDLSVFDFFTGNQDRHHFERIEALLNDSMPIHLDNGRSFGRPFFDDMSILEPIRQCCLFRYSTYKQLKHLYENKFSKIFDESMQSDPLYPLLTGDHLKAIDRRVVIIFNELNRCIDKYSVESVVIDDGH